MPIDKWISLYFNNSL